MIDERELAKFYDKLIENKHDYVKLLFLIFPYGDPDHPEMCSMTPSNWELEVLEEMSRHFTNPKTKNKIFRKAISSGNGARKTSLYAKIAIMLLYTIKGFRGRVTANTQPQMQQVVWPEYNKWFRYANHLGMFFDLFGTSIKPQ